MIKRVLFSIIEKLYFLQKNNLALYCKLTGVYNRNWLDYICEKKYQGKDCYIVMIDVDHFKCINDTYGHSKGDEVLRYIAFSLQIWFPKAKVVRYGGDEFVLINDDNPYLKLQEMCSKLDYSLSYGIIRKRKEDDLQQIINEADRKMYINKINKKDKKI